MNRAVGRVGCTSDPLVAWTKGSAWLPLRKPATLVSTVTSGKILTFTAALTDEPQDKPQGEQ
jgi:hypothetical protein